MVNKKRYRFRRSLILPLIYIFLTALSFSTLNTNKTNSKFFDSKNRELNTPSIMSLYDNSTNTVSIAAGNETSVTFSFGYAFHSELATDISNSNPVNYNLYFNEGCRVVELGGVSVNDIRTKTFTSIPQVSFVNVKLTCNLSDILEDDKLFLNVSLKEQYGSEMEFDYKDYYFEKTFEEYQSTYFPHEPSDDKTPEENFYEELTYAINNYADNISTSGLLSGVATSEYVAIEQNIKAYFTEYYTDVASVTYDSAKFNGLPGIDMSYNPTTEEYSFEIDDNIISYSYSKARNKLYYFIINRDSDAEKKNDVNRAFDVYLNEYYSDNEDTLRSYFSLVSDDGISSVIIGNESTPGITYSGQREIILDVDEIAYFMTLENTIPILKTSSKGTVPVYFQKLWFITRSLNITESVSSIYLRISSSALKSYGYSDWPIIRDFYAYCYGYNSNDFVLLKFYNGESTDKYNYVDVDHILTEDDVNITIAGNTSYRNPYQETNEITITVTYEDYEHAKATIGQVNSFFGIDDSSHPLPDTDPMYGVASYNNGSYAFSIGTEKNYITYSFYKYDDASTTGVNEEMTIVYDAASDQSISSFSMNSKRAPQTSSLVDEEDEEEEQGLGDKVIDTIESLMFLPRFLKSLF